MNALIGAFNLSRGLITQTPTYPAPVEVKEYGEHVTPEYW